MILSEEIMAALDNIGKEIKRISIAMVRHANDPAKIRSLARELESLS